MATADAKLTGFVCVIVQAENVAVKGSQSLQEDAAAVQNGAQQAAAAMQAVDGLQQSLSQIAGKLLPMLHCAAELLPVLHRILRRGASGVLLSFEQLLLQAACSQKQHALHCS